MTRVELLEVLKAFCLDATKDILLPTAVQKGDTEQVFRAPEVHKLRLPDSDSYKKFAPYIIIQIPNGMDKQSTGLHSEATTVVRMIFCVYNDNESEGAIMCLNLMETVRIALLKTVTIDGVAQLDTNAGLESMLYLDDTAPYFAGELIGTFKTAPVDREVKLY